MTNLTIILVFVIFHKPPHLANIFKLSLLSYDEGNQAQSHFAFCLSVTSIVLGLYYLHNLCHLVIYNKFYLVWSFNDIQEILGRSNGPIHDVIWYFLLNNHFYFCHFFSSARSYLLISISLFSQLDASFISINKVCDARSVMSSIQ